MQLHDLSSNTIREFGKSMYAHYKDQAQSFEEASQGLVTDVFNQFTSEDGEPVFALVRIYRTTTYHELAPELQEIAEPKDAHYLALMGTYGLEEAWCDRHQSQKRKAIHISDSMSPMFKGIFRELGFSWDDETDDALVAGEAMDSMTMIRLFHVTKANESTFITDQTQFVDPYQIQSVIASGTKFISGEAFVMIGFTTIPLDSAQAKVIVEATPYIATLLARFDGKKALWA